MIHRKKISLKSR